MGGTQTNQPSEPSLSRPDATEIRPAVATLSPSAAATEARASRLRAMTVTERSRKFRAKQAEIKALGPDAPAVKAEAEGRQVEPLVIETDPEIIRNLAFVFGSLVWPILSGLLRLFGKGRLEALDDSDQAELGRAFLPWAKRHPGLAWAARWAAAPAVFLAKVATKYRSLRTETQRNGQDATATATATAPQRPGSNGQAVTKIGPAAAGAAVDYLRQVEGGEK